MVSDYERYKFDLKGYVTIPDALNADQLQQLNSILDERIAEEVPADKVTHRFVDPIEWGQPYVDLLDNPAVDSHLREWVDQEYRVDHVYLDIIRGGHTPGRTSLHGGGSPYQPGLSYNFRNGRPYVDLIVVAYNLHDVNPGDGGFACVPGSHKANYPLPREVSDASIAEHPLNEKVAAPAGTAIVFTEAMSHGTLPWTASHQRRTLFVKYNHPAVAWSGHYLNAADFPEATQRQKEILEAPNARFDAARNWRGKKQITGDTYK